MDEFRRMLLAKGFKRSECMGEFWERGERHGTSFVTVLVGANDIVIVEHIPVRVRRDYQLAKDGLSLAKEHLACL